jgi:hypothetical protein
MTNTNKNTNTSLVNYSDKYIIFKDNIPVVSSNTENGAWKLIGAKNLQDREFLSQYGFAVKENKSQ